MSIHSLLLNRIRAIGCSVAAVAFFAFGHCESLAQKPDPPSSGSGVVVVESKLMTERKTLFAQVDKLFKAGKYAELDGLASDLRRKKTIFPGGRWYLDRFYQFLSLADDAPEHEWKDRIAKMETWIKARPNSITARLALARTMLDYAWKGRSSDYASNVQEAQWKMFRERIAKAHEILYAAQKMPEKCPCWYDIMLTLALGESFSRAEVDRIFNESIKKEPKYLAVYAGKLVILLPRWSGKEGEWQQFLRDSADKLGGVEGDKLYARVLWDRRDQLGDQYKEEFHSGRLSWERVKKGFQALSSDYPDDLTPPSEFCSWCVLVGDRAQAKELFQKLGNRVVLNAWHTTDRFKQARIWAMGSG